MVMDVDMEKIEESAESSRREIAVQAPPPFYIPDGCPLNYCIDLQANKDLDKEREAITMK